MFTYTAAMVLHVQAMFNKSTFNIILKNNFYRIPIFWKSFFALFFSVYSNYCLHYRSAMIIGKTGMQRMAITQ